MTGLNKIASLSNKPLISLAKRYAVPPGLYPSKAAQARYIWKYAKKSRIFRNNSDLEKAFAKQDTKIAGQDERIAKQDERIAKNISWQNERISRRDDRIARLEEDLSWVERMQRVFDRQDEEFARLKEEFETQNKAIAELQESFWRFRTKRDPKKDDAQLQEDYEDAKDKWFEARAKIIEKYGNAEAWKERVKEP